MNKIQRIKELIQELNQASALYYNGKQSKLSDKEWDGKFDELKSLEQEVGVVYNNSPTQNVGFEILNNLEKVTHIKPMLSLDKTKDINELKSFLGDKVGVLSWKEDGLTIILTYENGVLTDAVTRGNGTIGSRIIHNAKVFKNIPQQINHKGRLVIRGEGLISKEDFEKINITGEYANPRNLASGSIMLLDSKLANQRHLQFKAFGIVECDYEIKNYSDQLIWLKIEQGFDTVEYYRITKDVLEKTVSDFKNQLENYQFATDGLVLMFDDLKYGDSLGSTSHHFNNAIAFKWNDTIVETELLDIEYQVGRTGNITPVAIFKKVEIEGSMVERATLHNLSILKSLELGLHDTLTVYKSNMIIPKIDDNLTRSNTIQIPTECPSCGHPISIKADGEAEFLVCNNPNCKAKLIQKISHYVSRDAMNIDGLSEATISKFIEKGFIESIIDLYKLEQYKNQIVKLEGFGLKSYNNLIASINKSKKCKLANFIFALGIPQVGKGTAKILAKHFENITRFLDGLSNHYDLSTLEDIGGITNQAIHDWWKSMDIVETVCEILEYIEFIENTLTNIVVEDNPFKGKSVYPTGKFTLKKDELKIKLQELGAIVESGYKKSLDMLIAGGDTSKSGKTAKAEKDGVKIVSEEFLMQYIK